MIRTDPNEWEHKGYVIQRHIHPMLSKYSISHKETGWHIDTASTFNQAKKVIEIDIFKNQINMSRNKNTYASAILQKRVPADLLPELREMVDIRVASFKREQAAIKQMQQKVKESK